MPSLVLCLRVLLITFVVSLDILPDLGNANHLGMVATNFQNLRSGLIEFYSIANFRQLLCPRHEYTRNGIDILIIEVQLDRFFDFLDWRAAQDDKLSGLVFDHILLLFIKFIVDGADNLLQHVLERDDADDRGMFINDKRQQLVCRLKMP